MLFCDKHLEKEFLNIEKKLKYIAIPIFSIISALFISQYPILLNKLFFYHLVTSFVGIFLLWFGIRFIIYFFRKYFPKIQSFIRISLQIAISTCIAVIINISFIYFNHNYGYESKGFLCELNSFDFKNFMIATLLFTILINAIYEGYYIFLKLSHTALETEHYKKVSIEANYQNLNSKLNPHFLFNSLNTLTTIVEENAPKAVSYIQELSLVYRYVLNSQKDTWIDLPSELKFSKSYINLLKMRFEENLIVYLEICEHHSTFFILPLTIQLLIENAVKHNEISNQHPLEVTIFCTNELLVVMNIKQKRNIIPSSTKIGLQNIKERYRLLVNKEVLVIETETEFTVKIPLVKGVKNENTFN